jgi:ribonuclease HII
MKNAITKRAAYFVDVQNEWLICALLCGVDEAGRGPLAGPVYAAAVILDSKDNIEGLADSKQLSVARREHLAAEIKSRAKAWAIACASAAEIDSHNILRASLLAMRRAVFALSIVPEQIVVDGTHCPAVNAPVAALVKGDSKVAAISAASILAKTARDAEMIAIHQRYPEYGFAVHKGYPTQQHISALSRHGPCIEHRRTFAPVKAMVGDAAQPQFLEIT